MKTQKLLTPIAFAIATTFSAGAFADDWDGSSAYISDTQTSSGNEIMHEATENDATVDGSLGGASGNVGVNVAAGDNNQQANAAAISTADALFVMGGDLGIGTANATIEVTQVSKRNTVTNYSTPNTASLTDSAGGASGNVGINIAAGQYNQQKNDMAVASSEEALIAGANVTVEQTSQGHATNNYAQIEYGEQQVSLSLNGGGSYTGTSDQQGDLYPDIWTGDSHPEGRQVGHFDLDRDVQGAEDNDPANDGGALFFNEAGTITLGGTVTGFMPVVTEFQAVTNNASLTDSLGGVSGNVGVNIAAGGGNQQSNSLAIAAGCNACVQNGAPVTPPPGGEAL